MGAIDYTPTVDKFTVKVTGGSLETYAYVRTTVSPGIHAYAEITKYATITLGTKKDGTQTLTFTEGQGGTTKTWKEIEEWVEIVEIAVAVLLNGALRLGGTPFPKP